jgi:hypothetical protein
MLSSWSVNVSVGVGSDSGTSSTITPMMDLLARNQALASVVVEITLQKRFAEQIRLEMGPHINLGAIANLTSRQELSCNTRKATYVEVSGLLSFIDNNLSIA